MSGRHKNLWLSRCGLVHKVTTYCKYHYKKALSHFDWRFPMNFALFSNEHEYDKNKMIGKMNISYILYFNSNGRKHVRPSNIKLSRQITMLKNVQITTGKTPFFNMSNHPQTWRIGELSAPSVYIYTHIYKQFSCIYVYDM